MCANFTDTYAMVGYVGLESLLINHLVNYSEYKITQESQVKECW